MFPPWSASATMPRPALPDGLPVADEAPVEQLIARVTSAQRLRTLHATVLGRAQTLKDERNIIAELPTGDPLEDATVLLVGRGRHHATLSVAIGERMGLIGALSVDTAERCLGAREVDGIVIGDGLSGERGRGVPGHDRDQRAHRDLPVGLLAAHGDVPALPNMVTARDPQVLLQRALPLVRARVLETALKRLLHSIEHKGMIDARTGLLNADAFGRALELAIEDAAERKATFSLARFAFDEPLDRRIAIDTARLVSRLVRDTDFACRQDDGAILFVFGDTGLRDAHVAARRLASVLKHTMLRLGDKPGRQPCGDARHAQARRYGADAARPASRPARLPRSSRRALNLGTSQARSLMSDTQAAHACHHRRGLGRRLPLVLHRKAPA